MTGRGLITAEPGTVQATVVAIGDRGIMLLGPPAVGKSDLALRLIDGDAALVADDLAQISQQGPWLIASAMPYHRARLFVSGVGVVPIARHQARARLSLVVRCSRDPAEPRGATLGCWRWRTMALPEITLPAMAASTPNKLRLALNRWGL